jgi:hypothetical protein
MSTICMKIDPGMHIGLHLVFFGKTGVTSHEVGRGRSSAKFGKVPLHGKARHSAQTCYIRERN